jgi:acyl-CoA ligase (AMP-forming) (exosortase A-associated)
VFNNHLLHELAFHSAKVYPDAEAVKYKNKTLTYSALASEIKCFAWGIIKAGLARQERIAIYLPKRLETVVAILGSSFAGGVFVPINSLLKSIQVAHILQDCGVRILITSKERVAGLADILPDCHDLHVVVLIDSKNGNRIDIPHIEIIDWESLMTTRMVSNPHRVIDTDIATILYTSGSTGKPKGVVLSHRNMLAGAYSVAQYLENTQSDRLLAVLPFSFDYGLSQLSTAFLKGASVVLFDYLFPRDVINVVAKERITGLAGVPPLWVQLAQLPWQEKAVNNLRYITNSGGAMPKVALQSLRSALPNTQVYLMYGLTEAFRSTYLHPNDVDKRPDSIGKAIPNAEILVVREDGTPCAPGEPGELVHRGSLVALGYWNDPQKTAERFRPAPNQKVGIVLPEIAVWSGDTVKMDEEEYIYFIGRQDDMIKTSGYRVSPTEVEEVVYETGLVTEASSIGVPHPVLGQAVVVVAVPKRAGEHGSERLIEKCKQQLPNFMVPVKIEWRTRLPRSPNGKIDRKSLILELKDLFIEEDK